MIHIDNAPIKTLTPVEKMDEFRWIAVKTLRHLLQIQDKKDVRTEVEKTVGHIVRWNEKIREATV